MPGPRIPSQARSRTGTGMGPGGDRFTKLKGVLVNNLLKEYHKKTNRKGDEWVYNQAVMEVEKILQHGKLTEQHLVELQRNFANGIMNMPAGVGGSMKKGGKSEIKLAMEQAKMNKLGITEQYQSGAHYATSDMQSGPAGQPMDPADQMGMSVGGAQAQMQQPTERDTVAPTPSKAGSPSKKAHVDEWSIITLFNDVRHYEEQKVHKAKVLEEKEKTRRMLQEQIEARKRQKDDVKKAEAVAAQEQMKNYEKWRAEKEHVEQLRQAKLLAERDHEAQALQKIQEKKKAQAEVELKEQQALLDEFARQIQEEKAEKERQIVVKQKAYQAMLEDNERVLEMKRQAKEAERQENLRLFQIQIEMAEKQERIRADRENERQQKLKKAERMAGELNNRAAELDAQLEDRVKRAQEEYRKKEAEREKNRREKKMQRDRETAEVLRYQVQQRENQKRIEKEEQLALAEKFKKDAEVYQKIKQQEREEKIRQRDKVQEMLNQQIAMRDMSRKVEGGMSGTELRMNASLLRQVLHKGPEVPEDLYNKISTSDALNRTEDEDMDPRTHVKQ